MHLRGRRLKFTAVLGFVVLSLTGFTGHGHGHYSRSHGSHSSHGGGCSSSAQDHDTSTSSHRNTYYDDDDYNSSSSSSSGSTYSTPSGHQDGTARLVSCATVKHPYATVEVTNPNAVRSGFDVHITFEDKDSLTVDGTIQKVTVPANGTKTVRVPVENAKESAPKVDHCDLDPVASYHW